MKNRFSPTRVSNFLISESLAMHIAGTSVFERDSRTAGPVRWEGSPRPRPEGASVLTRGGESASAGEALEGIGQAN